MTFYLYNEDQAGEAVGRQLKAGDTVEVIAGVTLNSWRSNRYVFFSDFLPNIGVTAAGVIKGSWILQLGARARVDVGPQGALVASTGGTAVFAPNGDVTIRNEGTISGRTPIYLTRDGNSVVNTGLIFAGGVDGPAIHFAYVPDEVASERANVVNNMGTIIAQNDDAISYNGLAPFIFYNSGTIRVGGYDHVAVCTLAGPLQFGNAGTVGSLAGLEGADIVSNAAGGKVDGSVSLGGGDDRLINAGTVSSYVDLGEGNDFLDSSAGTLGGPVYGGGGDDVVLGSGGEDVLYGGQGGDLLSGGYGADQLYGNQSDDVLYGNQNDDWIHGGQGNDVLYGGQGNDTVNGGVGDDVLFGNLGDDLFVFWSPGFGRDTVADFGRGADRIQFTSGAFTDFADMLAHTADLDGGVLITTPAGDTVRLAGVTLAGLDASQFLFG